jgi:predicted peptidase
MAQDPKPEPGKQVPQKLTVPKSTSVWQWRGGGGDFAKLLATPKPLDESATEVMQYMLYLPKSYNADSDKEWPLILFLHGAGERGDDINLVAVHGPPKLIAKEPGIADVCPFIVVSPQCHTDRYWAPAQLHLLLDEIEKNYKVDKKRIYVTGLSMGGFGTWMLTADRPERFAAAAPICGGNDPANAAKFVNMPVWAFHGTADSLVPVKLTEEMVKAIEDAGGKKVKMTLYPGVNHDSWTQTYENRELYEWFLSHALE